MWKNFRYDKETGTYTRPEGHGLTTTGKWHQAKTYMPKRHTTKQCKSCPAKPECPRALYGKGIQRSEYQELIGQNKKRVKENEKYYKRWQAIVGRPFGTIKRQWGFSYILTKKSWPGTWP
jgi:hypothetical protein